MGIAWDVRGDGKTAVRIGGGQFFQREPVGLAERLANTAPFVINATTNRSLDAAPPLASPAVSPSAFKTTNGFLPNSWQWNVSVEQEVARNTTLQIGYVGNDGVHLTSMWDSNAVPAADFLAGHVYQRKRAERTPSGLQLRPDRRLCARWPCQLQLAAGAVPLADRVRQPSRRLTPGPTRSATWNWTIRLAASTSRRLTDQSNPGLDKGNTNINRPNIFVANEVLYLPKLQQYNKFVQQTVGGWEANSIFTMAEGSSLTIFTNGGSLREHTVNGSIQWSERARGNGLHREPTAAGQSRRFKL